VVLSRRLLVETPELRVAEVRCSGQGARWSAPEPISGFGVVLPRRGVFVRRVDGVERTVDPLTGYVQRPDTEQQMAHPAGGDVCTSIWLASPAARSGTGWTAGAVHVRPRIGLAHRLLVRRAAAGADPVELVDLAGEIVAAVLGGPAPERAGEAGEGSRTVDGAREILTAEPGCPLPELARRLEVSPWHLSRMFHRTVGITLRRYRVRLRTTAALDLLAAEQHSLGEIAAAVGFADQAHMTRSLRAELGRSPGRLRALLSEARGSQEKL
jgi:AraC-like DNA-binding protein